MLRAVALFLFLFACSASAVADDSAELTGMLNEFLAGASIDDAAAHDRFWAEDLVYTSSAGERFGKADIMREIATRQAADTAEPATVYTAEDIRIRQYGDVAVVAFRLVATPGGGSESEGAPLPVLEYFNTGTFLNRAGRWQVVAWQATRIPGSEPAAPQH
jgi:ketosteroid isomerase-like protein